MLVGSSFVSANVAYASSRCALDIRPCRGGTVEDADCGTIVSFVIIYHQVAGASYGISIEIGLKLCVGEIIVGYNILSIRISQLYGSSG